MALDISNSPILPGRNVTYLVETTIGVTNVSTKDPDLVMLHEVSKWINGFIIVLGLITNTLIIIVLSRTRIGCITTKIILLFLACNDLLVMVVELFLHYIPYYWKWFQIYYTHTCGLAFTMQSVVVTSASWYITLMTIERFIAVWLPMKARFICTKKTTVIICCCIPVLCTAIYSYLLTMIVTVTDPKTGYRSCKPAKYDEIGVRAFKAIIQVWATAYFFIPAAVIVILNAAIVWKLKASIKLQHVMTQSTKTNYSTCSSSENRAGRLKQKVPSSVNSVRKATTLVIVASVTFVILMIPRGVSVSLVMDAAWKYNSKAEEILDSVSYLLQYLNHATNFFIYILANLAFRRELLKMFCCGKKTPMFTTTSATQMETAIDHV